MSDEIVLITGAAGSIGSALARRVAKQKPQQLILLDNNESGLFDIQQELHTDSVIASVRDEQRIKEVFAEYKPTVVFHVAAYKHVPLMEDWSMEAITTNFGGTLNVIWNALRYKVKKFVFISTDKAAKPLSIMGLTKKYGEKLCKMAAEFTPTSFVIVRFGNVMASRGSVVPIFQKQIDKGGPVTVTDEQMTRYFMGIYDAVELILEATKRDSGVYLLDMGEPQKIMDLAKQMIRLSGKDIEIVITGIREGEKIHERLHDPDTETTTKDGNLLVVKDKDES